MKSQDFEFVNRLGFDVEVKEGRFVLKHRFVEGETVCLDALNKRNIYDMVERLVPPFEILAQWKEVYDAEKAKEDVPKGKPQGVQARK